MAKPVRKERLVAIAKAKSAYKAALKNKPGHITRSAEQMARTLITSPTPKWGGLKIKYGGQAFG